MDSILLVLLNIKFLRCAVRWYLSSGIWVLLWILFLGVFVEALRQILKAL